MKKLLFSIITTAFSIMLFAQAPANYYNGTAGLTGAALKTKLSQIITNGHVDHGYGGLWTGYATTDRDYYYENDGTILDIYSENPTGPDPYNFTLGTNQCGNNGPEGTCYNREHIVPQSLFNSVTPMYSDIHFIRPTDSKVNGMRSNYPFGKVATASYTSLNGSKLGSSASAGYSGTVFEPVDAFKGDVARMVLYFVTRYESQLSGFLTTNGMLGGSSFPGLQTWELNQLLLWNAQDPVSPAEIGRNNASYTYQGNRNPFIDNPQWANDIWGTPVIDTQAPTVPTNLVANNPTSNSIALNWTASTDNVGVTGYDIYANGTFNSSSTTNSKVVSGLAPSTTYNFYVIARDAAGNSSPQSNVATETTLAGPSGGSCGSEDFTNIPASDSGYQTRTWSNNNITWTATDARTDQTINGKAITVRNGSLLSSSISGGIESLTITTKLPFSDTAGNLNLKINGTVVGTIPYSPTSGTFTVNNINVTGNFTIEIVNPSSGKRISMDDLSWVCYTILATAEVEKDKAFSISPNPIKNKTLSVTGKNLKNIKKAEIYNINGRLIQTITNPFQHSNQIQLNTITQGVYILKIDNNTSKFIVE